MTAPDTSLIVPIAWFVCVVLIFCLHASTTRALFGKDEPVEWLPAAVMSLLGPLGLLIVLAFNVGATSDGEARRR